MCRTRQRAENVERVKEWITDEENCPESSCGMVLRQVSVGCLFEWTYALS